MFRTLFILITVIISLLNTSLSTKKDKMIAYIDLLVLLLFILLKKTPEGVRLPGNLLF